MTNLKVGSIVLYAPEPDVALGVVLGISNNHPHTWAEVYWFDLKEIQPACADVLEVLVP